MIVGAQVRAALVGAHAGHDRVEGRQVAEGEAVGVDQGEARPELFDGGRHLVADAHHVAHPQSRRDARVNRLQGRHRGQDPVAPGRVRVFDDLVTSIE
ncbi:MAG: hypothetical protein HGA82_02725, partial [Anaerolineales bacterium]|nr:hypothetical protein [Anaerolineales bacterium]